MLATYKFVFNRKNIPLKKGETAVVQMRITLNRRARYISTGIYLEKKQWNGRSGEWIIAHPQAPEYNAYLKRYESIKVIHLFPEKLLYTVILAI